MRAKTIYPNTFQDFYDSAPKEIKDILEKSKTTPQTAIWHPEAPFDEVPHNVFAHINIVFNRAKRTGDISLMLAAIFHDLGKVFTTVKHPTIPNKWSSRMHEKVSARLVEKYRNWIENLGGDYDIIYYIVDQHMRAKQLDQMRQSKQQIFKQHKYFDLLQQFTEFDNMQHNYSND